MLAVVSWQCDCGIRVKVMYETEGANTVRCPNSLCKATHIITGKVTSVWEDNGTGWQPREFANLVIPPQDNP